VDRLNWLQKQNPNPGIHKLALGHQSRYNVSGVGVKDVRVYPTPLELAAFNTEFDNVVASLNA